MMMYVEGFYGVIPGFSARDETNLVEGNQFREDEEYSVSKNFRVKF